MLLRSIIAAFDASVTSKGVYPCLMILRHHQWYFRAIPEIEKSLTITIITIMIEHRTRIIQF